VQTCFFAYKIIFGLADVNTEDILTLQHGLQWIIDSNNTQIIQCVNDTIIRHGSGYPVFLTGSGTSEPVPWNRFLRQSINQSINQFISRHTTEARATVRFCQIKEKCLKTDLKYVNGWSSSTVQWK